MKTLIFGEKRHIAIKLSPKSGTFAITGATYEVRAEDRTKISEEGVAGVDGLTVWMLLDSTKYAIGDTLYVYFWVSVKDTQKLVNGVVRVEIAK